MLASQHTTQFSKIPFVVAVAKGIEAEAYRDAIAAGERIEASYDKLSQTSSIGVFAGTQLTYDSTTTDWSIFTDDTRQSDT